MAETIAAAAPIPQTSAPQITAKSSQDKKRSNSRWKNEKKKKRKIEDVEMEDADADVDVDEDPAGETVKQGQSASRKKGKDEGCTGKAGKHDGKAKDNEYRSGEENPVSKKRKTKTARDSDGNAGKPSQNSGVVDENGEGPSKKNRFIVFVGNLPFTATTENLQKHFASVKPSHVRLITHKEDPKKCRGYAFLEFDSFDRMKTCLSKFHHSMFYADGEKPEDDKPGKGGRKINVELTTGGGGTSNARRQKLSAKNEKLNGERRRRLQEEDKLKSEKQAKTTEESGAEGIHPSRLARMEGGDIDHPKALNHGQRRRRVDWDGRTGGRGGGRTGGRGGGRNGGRGGRGGGGRGGRGRGWSRGRGGGRS